MNKVEKDDRVLKGLQDRGLITLSCNHCEMPLLCLQLTSPADDQDGSVISRICVRCVSCEGYSDVMPVRGQFYPGAPSDDMVFDIADGYDDAPEADILFQAWRK
jgi:hypothetical protein